MIRGVAITVAAWAAGALLLRGTVLAPEQCPDPGETGLRVAADEAVAWIERSLQPDDRYVYEWNGATGARSTDYNEVRHAGVTMSLYQYAALTGDAEAVAIGDRGLVWMLDNLERGDDWAALRTPGSNRLKLGASALMAAGLVLRRDATGDEGYDDLIRELGRFQLLLQRPDGSFLNFYDIEIGAPVAGETSKYATGEAFWALAMVHNRLPGEGWDAPTLAVADYLALDRDAAEGFPYPPWADQWAAYGLSEMAAWGLEEHHVAYARSLAGRFGLLVRSEMKRRDGEWSEAVRGRMARAAGMGTWVEGLNGLWRLADAEPRLSDLRSEIGERAVCGAGMLTERQVDATEAAGYAEASLAQGAWFSEDVTRMDDQQHALSGIILTLAHIDDGEGES